MDGSKQFFFWPEALLHSECSTQSTYDSILRGVYDVILTNKCDKSLTCSSDILNFFAEISSFSSSSLVLLGCEVRSTPGSLRNMWRMGLAA